ncbi:uncharacterized protein LOC143566558 isoform X2 [Bidens hawaiensis]|uniref:uncharacterized protein LOC143566558 isoform X2 n=1 Tax=Bidens hawaiensis TaxID=980011 RepID=UPI004049C7F3
MDSDRPPPQRTVTTSDLFICFTSRHHHSISSKSILSPGRTSTRDPPFSLTTSLSRRLRTNRSIKGAASPATFPATGKKKNGSFDNQEPSSPKVTCIGQVRIKSKKKQAKRLRSLSRRRNSGDISFRRKSTSLGSSFGSNQDTLPEQRKWVHLPLTICEALREFSCLFPCRFSCFSPASREKVDKGSSGFCSAVLTRWLVAVNDGGGGSRRDIELVVGDESEDEVEVVEDDDGIIKGPRRHVFDDLEVVNNRIQGTSIDEGRVSICIPPKNALLLMRCRSDPLKMEALANRLWESTAGQSDDNDDQDDDDSIVEVEIQDFTCSLNKGENNQETVIEDCSEDLEEKDSNPESNNEKDEEYTFFGSLFDEIILDQDQETDETKNIEHEGDQGLPECLLLMMYEPKLSMEVSKETWVSSKDFIQRQSSKKKPPVKPADGQSKVNTTTTTRGSVTSVSKFDTHVAAPAPVQPGRSSCSLPAPSSMAEMLEQKLVNAVGYEPFVLTRCKSEPMRTAAAKLAPDNCFWKNRKLEPLRRASFGVGAAGIGF